MNANTLGAMRRIVLYLAKDEAKHWEESNKPKRHIYKDVLMLARFVDKATNNEKTEWHEVNQCENCGNRAYVLHYKKRNGCTILKSSRCADCDFS